MQSNVSELSAQLCCMSAEHHKFYFNLLSQIFAVLFFTFQEVLSGDEALIVLAEAWCPIQQEVGALILVDPEQNLSVFKVA